MDVINKAETFPAFLSRNLCTFNFSRYLRWKFCVKLALEAKPTFVQCPHPHHNSDVESEERQTESGGWRGSTQCCHTSLLHNSHRCLLWKELLCLTGERQADCIPQNYWINSPTHQLHTGRHGINLSCPLLIHHCSHCPSSHCALVRFVYQFKTLLDIAEIPGKSDIAEYTRKIWPRGFIWCCRLRKQPHIVHISGICWRATSQWDLFRMEETIVVTTATPAAVNLGRTAVQ